MPFHVGYFFCDAFEMISFVNFLINNHLFDDDEKHEECMVCCLIILSINYNKKMASYVIYTIHSIIPIYNRWHLIRRSEKTTSIYQWHARTHQLDPSISTHHIHHRYSIKAHLQPRQRCHHQQYRTADRWKMAILRCHAARRKKIVLHSTGLLCIASNIQEKGMVSNCARLNNLTNT